jgi:hypothetical protein
VGRGSIASGNPFTVRALAFIIAGHVAHHMALKSERKNGGCAVRVALEGR